MDRLVYLVLLAAFAANAEVPDKHVSAGLGVSASKPLGARHSLVWNPSSPGESAFPLQPDFALSAELGFETTHTLVGFSFEEGGLANEQPKYWLAGKLRDEMIDRDLVATLVVEHNSIGRRIPVCFALTGRMSEWPGLGLLGQLPGPIDRRT